MEESATWKRNKRDYGNMNPRAIKTHVNAKRKYIAREDIKCPFCPIMPNHSNDWTRRLAGNIHCMPQEGKENGAEIWQDIIGANQANPDARKSQPQAP